MCCKTGRRHFLAKRLTTRLAAVLVLLALAVVGCGKKGDPLPPLRDIPLTTTDLSVLQQGRLLVLELAYPTTTVSGMSLGGIDALELLQLTKPANVVEESEEDLEEEASEEGEEPLEEDTPEEAQPEEAQPEEAQPEEAQPVESEDADESQDDSEEESKAPEVLPVQPAEFEASAEVVLTLRGTELLAAVTGDRIQVRVPLADELPEEELAHYYGVRTLKADETSEISNIVGLVPEEPPAAPQNLKAEARPKAIELTWETDSEVEGFEVFRREARERGYTQPIGRVPAELNNYTDRRVEYGKKYIYTVRSVARLEPLLLSDEAGEREIDYVDRFAPPVPKSLVALGERSRVRLRWEASDDDDVAGYILLRREPRREEFRRLNDELVTGVEYIDRGLTSGFSYEYRIQAVDFSGNESRVSEKVSTTVR